MHWKRLLRNAMVGMLTGIALSQIIAIIAAYALRLGYFMPYPAALPEIAGGELNAVALIMAVSGLLGMGISLALGFVQYQDIKPHNRRIAILLSLTATILPFLILLIIIMS